MLMEYSNSVFRSGDRSQALDDRADIVRLVDEVIRAQQVAASRHFGTGGAGKNDYLGGTAVPPDMFQYLQATHVGKADIEQHRVRVRMIEHRQRVSAVADRCDRFCREMFPREGDEPLTHDGRLFGDQKLEPAGILHSQVSGCFTARDR